MKERVEDWIGKAGRALPRLGSALALHPGERRRAMETTMRIFTTEDGSRTNFVDETDTYVGFDSGQSCCESWDWWIEMGGEKALCEAARQETPAAKWWGLVESVLKGFAFDLDFFEEENDDEYEAGGRVRFRLIGPDGAEAFLVLENLHNGYYSHGFSFMIARRSGSI